MVLQETNDLRNILCGRDAVLLLDVRTDKCCMLCDLPGIVLFRVVMALANITLCAGQALSKPELRHFWRLKAMGQRLLMNAQGRRLAHDRIKHLAAVHEFEKLGAPHRGSNVSK